METQLSNERERAVSAEEHGRSVERQLAEEQQNRDRTAKKREEAEAELAAQVPHDYRVSVKQQRPTIADSACLSQLCPSNLHACIHASQLDCQIQSYMSDAQHKTCSGAQPQNQTLLITRCMCLKVEHIATSFACCATQTTQ